METRKTTTATDLIMISDSSATIASHVDFHSLYEFCAFETLSMEISNPKLGSQDSLFEALHLARLFLNRIAYYLMCVRVALRSLELARANLENLKTAHCSLRK